MNFLPRNKISKTRRTKKLAVVVIILFAFLTMQYFGVNPFSSLSQNIASPSWKLENKATSSIDGFFSLLNSKKSITEENNRLKDQLAEIEYVMISNRELKEENIDLKSILNRADDRNLTLASVLSKPNSSMYDTFIIDVGSNMSVGVGDSIIAHGDFIIGSVSKVYPNSSQVTLFSSPGEKLTVMIGEESIPAIAEGRGGGNFLIKLPRDIDVEKGDVITLPNINLQVFGVVEEIITSPESSFKIILFKNPVNIYTLKWVEIVLNK